MALHRGLRRMRGSSGGHWLPHAMHGFCRSSMRGTSHRQRLEAWGEHD
jgi:hypothetical protein